MPKAPKANRATGLITINRVVKTPAQTAWLAERLPEFAAAQTEGKLSEFWPKIREQYLAAFPVPGMDDDSLPQEEREKVAEAVQRVREVSLILKLRSRSIIYISESILTERLLVVQQQRQRPQAPCGKYFCQGQHRPSLRP